MSKKVISPEQFNNLPRAVRRALNRQATKEGRELPDKLPEMLKVYFLAKKDLWNRGVEILENNGMDIHSFLNTSLEQLIEAERKAKQTKLR